MIKLHNYTVEQKEQADQQAYEDVLKLKEPSHPTDELYMWSYRFWVSIIGSHHFNYFELYT